MAETIATLRERVVQRLTDWPGIVFAVLYGSAVDGEGYRDLDIGVWVDRAVVPPARDIDYAFDLIDVLEPLSPVPVAVRVINDAPLPFRYNVRRWWSTTRRSGMNSWSAPGTSGGTSSQW
jgi:predicted nucleotidyltransferase